MEADTFKQLQEADWETLGIELAGHAAFRARNLGWRTGNPVELARGLNPVDLAQEAILKVLDGSRRWDPKRGPLLPYLKGVVDSRISQLAESLDNQLQIRLPEGEEGEELGDHLEFHAPRHDHQGWLSQQPSTPERAVVEKRSETADQQIGNLFEAVGDKPDLRMVLEAVMELEDPKPAAIAERLGVPVSDINNRLKRLRRLALKLENDGRQPATAVNTDAR